MVKDLQELMNIVDKVFICDEAHYRKLQYLPKEMWNEENISHSARHLSKSAGKLEGVCEDYEHNAPFNKDEAKSIILSALATVLKTASMLDMNAKDLLEGVPIRIEYMPEKADTFLLDKSALDTGSKLG